MKSISNLLLVPGSIMCRAVPLLPVYVFVVWTGAVVSYKGHLESKERFAIQRYLLIIGKKKNMQVL